MVTLYKKELDRIEDLLNESLTEVDDDDVHGRYEVHRMAFNELMRMVKVYGPMLSCIKDEYETLIGHVLNNQQYARQMTEELRTACSYPRTIENYERRCVQQRLKLHQLRRDREHKMEQVRDVQVKCQSLRRAMESGSSNEESQGQVTVHRREIRRLQCMSLSSLTDLTTMQTMCDQLVTQRQQLQRTQTTKYVSKNEQIQLEYQLKERVDSYDCVRQDVKNLIRRKFLLQAALTQIHSSDNCRNYQQNIGEVILKSLVQGAKSIEEKNDKSDEDSIEEEINKFFPESTKPLGSMKESDYIVLCIRQFEKLFQENKFKEAADLAVIVPRGVLRNYSTLLKFKEAGGNSLLYYCQQVIVTMKSGRLDSDMSYECVDIALKEGRIDLINLWITKARLESSELIADNLTCHADLIPDHKTACLDLAAAIYWDLLVQLTSSQSAQSKTISPRDIQSNWSTSRRKYFDSILECRIKSGRIEEAVEMLTKENVTPVSARSVGTMYNEKDLLLLVHYYPNIELVESLIRKELLSLEAIFGILLESEFYGVLANLMVRIWDTTKDMSTIIEKLSCESVGEVSTEAWESMLNFVDKSNEKIIIEIAASYLVGISLERSCLALSTLDFDNVGFDI